MPREIDEAFSQGGAHLFPASEEDLWTSCTCPDWANPCKHVAAAHYVLADLIDRDPFVLFDMRGRSKDEVLGALGKALGAGDPAPAAGDLAEETIGVTPDLEKGYDTPRAPLRVKLRIQVPPIPAAVLRQIGSPPGWSLPSPIAEVLRPVYESTGQLARSIALAVDSEALAAVREEAAPRVVHAKANRPLTTTTTMIAAASCGIPASQARQLANQSRMAKKWVTCRASRRKGEGGRPTGSLFGPCRSNRRLASTVDRPTGGAASAADCASGGRAGARVARCPI
jgi:hypothetical protein